MNCTIHLFKDQPEDGPTIGPKHVAGIITWYNLIKYKMMYDCLFISISFTTKHLTDKYIRHAHTHT